ncbi:FG-GAP repeat protein [Nostoc sp.]|uniref:FG-GAP repeat protein n=1 Tax=Nostoc sp. TaxID=1180 RepID=UPI002FFC13EE
MVTPASPFSVTVGDFNGDGKQDLAAANYNSNNVSVLLNANPSATLTIAEPVAPVIILTNTALAYTENDPGITVTDVDSTSLSSATTTI